MTNRLNEQFEVEAAIDANETIEGAVECLQLLKELVGKCSLKDLVLLNAYVVSYQSAYMTYVIENRLADIVESIDCAGAKSPDFWMTSNEAAKDKAKEIGLDVPLEWTPADLRYKLHQAIYGGDNG